MKCPHDAYVCPHPRKSGYFVYCADCNLVTGPHSTQDAAVKAWREGHTHVAKKSECFDGSEYINPVSLSEIK